MISTHWYSYLYFIVTVLTGWCRAPGLTPTEVSLFTHGPRLSAPAPAVTAETPEPESGRGAGPESHRASAGASLWLPVFWVGGRYSIKCPLVKLRSRSGGEGQSQICTIQIKTQNNKYCEVLVSSSDKKIQRFPEPSLNHFWTLPEPFLNLTWTIPEPYLNHSWTIPEPFLNHSWTIPEPSLNLPWTFAEPFLNPQEPKWTILVGKKC